MAIYNPIRKQVQRVIQLARPPGELTGDAVSRAAAEIEKELDGNTTAVDLPTWGKGGIMIDEVRVYSRGVQIAAMPINHGRPVVMQRGDSYTLTDLTIKIS